MANRHPVVRGYTTSSKRTLEIVEMQPEPREPIVEVMGALYKAGAHGTDLNSALQAAERIKTHRDPELYFFFLCLWAYTAAMGRRLQYAEAVLSRAETLAFEQMPPELMCLKYQIEGLCSYILGDKNARLRAAEQGLSLLPRSSPRYALTAFQRALALAERGRLADVGVEFDELRASDAAGQRPEPLEFDLVHFIDACECGRLAEAEGYLRSLDACTQPQINRSMFIAKPLYMLMSGRWQPPDSGKPMAWETSAWHLLAGRVEEALVSAREAAGTLDVLVGFPVYTLIRAELAAGNRAAAQRLLEEQHSQGRSGHIHDLLCARARLLMDDHSAAAAHFAAAKNACSQYRAEERLDFELRLAPEISPGDLVRLGEVACGMGFATLPAPHTQRTNPTRNQGVKRLLGRSTQISAVRDIIRKCSPHHATVLIRGETGTGKELVARALHEESPRREEPFIAVNCGAISDPLLAPELFGHEKGAFTGAERARKGLFEEAAAGTLFLDEIGDISPQLQVVLLRVLESGETRPVGSNRPRKTNCRVVAATNAGLESRVEEGLFRRDLLYRLKPLEICLPPLRDRPADILPLAYHFLSSDRHDACRSRMSEELETAFCAYAWPGNVRELRNVVERMRLLNSDKPFYEVGDLVLGCRRAPSDPPAGVGGQLSAGPSGSTAPETLNSGTSTMRRLARLRKLFDEVHDLTRLEAARLLGVSPGTATRYLKQLCREGYIVKVTPSASPRSHYFSVRQRN